MVRYILLLIVALSISTSAYSQIITQTYVDRCTGEVFRFNIQAQGATVVMFYNKARAFTALDVSSGVFRSWLEETYNWWRNISPCSINQSTVTATTQTTQQITNTVINIAPPPIPPPPPPNTPSTTSSNSTQSSTTSSKSSQSESSNNSESSSESSNNSESTAESDGGESESSESDGGESESSESSEEEEDKEGDKKKSLLTPQ